MNNIVITMLDEKILGGEFEIWPADPISDTKLIIIGIYVTNLGLIEDRSFCFIELLNGSTEKSNIMLVRLNITAVILEINNHHQPDLINLEIKQINKKKKRLKSASKKKLI